MNVRELLGVLRRRWRVAATAFLICLLGAAAFTAVRPKTYTATTRLFATVETSGGAAGQVQAAQFAQLQLKSLPGLVTSAEVLRPVIDSQSLGMTPDALSKRVTASVVVDMLWMDISVQDSDPVKSQAVASAVARQVISSWSRLNAPTSTPVRTRLSVVTPAQVPTAVTSPKLAPTLAAGLVVGLLLGVGAAILHEATLRHLSTPFEIERHLGLPFLGVISVNTDYRTRPRAAADMATALTAWVEMPSILLVAAAGDGSRVASQAARCLGAGFADLGRTTAVLDLSEAPADSGHGDHSVDLQDLHKEAEHWRVPAVDSGPNVITLGAGVDALQFAGSLAIERMISQLHQNRDVVLIAAPSSSCGLGIVAVGRLADCALLVSMPRESRAGLITARKQLAEHATRVVGYARVLLA